MDDERDQGGEGGPPEPSDDTEGHYLASYEYGRIVAKERQAEGERAARASRLIRETKPEKKR